jgi:hypothetical protein
MVQPHVDHDRVPGLQLLHEALEQGAVSVVHRFFEVRTLTAWPQPDSRPQQRWRCCHVCVDTVAYPTHVAVDETVSD